MSTFRKETTLDNLSNGIIRHILAYGGDTMAIEVNFEQGAIDPVYSHPYEQLTYVLSGEFEFIIGERKYIVRVGDTLYRQPNIMRGCACLKPGTLLDTFIPIREDSLYG